jgi:hypothetical protein
VLASGHRARIRDYYDALALLGDVSARAENRHRRQTKAPHLIPPPLITGYDDRAILAIMFYLPRVNFLFDSLLTTR